MARITKRASARISPIPDPDSKPGQQILPHFQHWFPTKLHALPTFHSLRVKCSENTPCNAQKPFHLPTPPAWDVDKNGIEFLPPTPHHFSMPQTAALHRFLGMTRYPSRKYPMRLVQNKRPPHWRLLERCDPALMTLEPRSKEYLFPDDAMDPTPLAQPTQIQKGMVHSVKRSELLPTDAPPLAHFR